jgi:transcriptional regulator of nitric oxide reductase
VGFVVDKVALGQVFPGVLRFSPVNFIPPVLHYLKKDEKIIIIFITSVASAAGPFTTKKKK